MFVNAKYNFCIMQTPIDISPFSRCISASVQSLILCTVIHDKILPVFLFYDHYCFLRAHVIRCFFYRRPLLNYYLLVYEFIITPKNYLIPYQITSYQQLKDIFSNFISLTFSMCTHRYGFWNYLSLLLFYLLIYRFGERQWLSSSIMIQYLFLFF